MRPVSEQTILVTGATGGLGHAVAGELAARGARVLVHGRSRESAEAAVAVLRSATGSESRLEPVAADLSSLAAVAGLAEEVSAREDRLDALVNNAGVGCLERAESADGYELTFAVNHLAAFLLTGRLLPLLQRSAPARIVNVASIGQAPVNFANVMLERNYDMSVAYSQSKLAMIATTFELAERLRGEPEGGVTVTALHPATLMPTKLVFTTVGRTVDSLEQGMAATVRLVVDPELEGVSGAYFDGLQLGRADSWAEDPENRRRLWTLSEQLCGTALSRNG